LAGKEAERSQAQNSAEGFSSRKERMTYETFAESKESNL
jgi:hypothetical protein